MTILRLSAMAGLFCLGVSTATAADAVLIEAARREGRVVWYTTQIVNQLVRPLGDAFEKKYGVKVDAVRADVSDIVLRIVNEAKAGRVQADVFDGTATVPPLKRAGVVMKWQPDAAKQMPAQFVDQDGYWVANNLYVHTPVFNTQLVQRGTEPHGWNDLLDPKYEGKIAISSLVSSSSGPGLVGTVFADMGEEKGTEYLKKLSGQRLVSLNAAARSMVDQVMAGEFSLGLQAFNHHAVISAAQGAPVDWIKWSPAMTVMSIVALTKDAPHPNAGKLLVDFLVSEEGQRIFAASDYIPMDPRVPAKVKDLKPDDGGFKPLYLTPEQLDASIGRWADIYKSIFR